MRLSQCSVALASFLPNTRIAIGIVLANPDKNSVQPSTFRFPCLNFPASNRLAPNPIAPRVAAIKAISGTVFRDERPLHSSHERFHRVAADAAEADEVGSETSFTI